MPPVTHAEVAGLGETTARGAQFPRPADVRNASHRLTAWERAHAFVRRGARVSARGPALPGSLVMHKLLILRQDLARLLIS